MLVVADPYILTLFKKYKDDPNCEREIVSDYYEYSLKEQQKIIDGVIKGMLLQMYNYKYDELKRDITNLLLLGSAKLDYAKRYETLKAVLPCIVNYYVLKKVH